MAPENITAMLGISPTRVSIRNNKSIKKNGWFFSTKDIVLSDFLDDHLIKLCNIFLVKTSDVENLKMSGAEARIFCFWESLDGNGGPVISSEIISLVSELKLDLHFDVWLS